MVSALPLFHNLVRYVTMKYKSEMFAQEGMKLWNKKFNQLSDYGHNVQWNTYENSRMKNSIVLSAFKHPSWYFIKHFVTIINNVVSSQVFLSFDYEIWYLFNLTLNVEAYFSLFLSLWIFKILNLSSSFGQSYFH